MALAIVGYGPVCLFDKGTGDKALQDLVMWRGRHLLVMGLHLTAIELLLDDSKIGMI